MVINKTNMIINNANVFSFEYDGQSFVIDTLQNFREQDEMIEIVYPLHPLFEICITEVGEDLADAKFSGFNEKDVIDTLMSQGLATVRNRMLPHIKWNAAPLVMLSEKEESKVYANAEQLATVATRGKNISKSIWLNSLAVYVAFHLHRFFFDTEGRAKAQQAQPSEAATENQSS